MHIKSTHITWPPAALFILLGALGTLGQVLFFREALVVAFGNELVFGLILFWWFLGVASGAGLGSRLAARAENPVAWLSALLLILPLAGLVELGVLRSMRLWMDIPAGEYTSLGELFTGAGLGVTPYSFLIGLVFPFAGQVAASVRKKEHPQWPGGASYVYVLEALGSLSAGMLFPFLLLPFLSPCRIFHLLAISVLVSSIVYFYFSHENRSRWRIAAFLIVPVLLLPAGRWQVLTETLRLRSQYGLFEHVETRQTPYQRLDLLERAGQYSLFGNGHFIGSFPDPYVWREKVHTALLQHASPESVLIAGGDPQMIPFVLAHGVEKVDWVEMDPELMDLRLEYGSREEQRWMQDKRVRLIREDARRFIRHTGNQASSHYDIILLNVADPSTAQLNRYYTGEFYREAVRALNERGVLVTSVQASVIATGTEVVDFARVIYGSLVRVFSHIALQPGQEIHFYACRAGGQVSEEAEVLARRYRQRNIEPEALAYAFEASFQPVQISDLRAELDSQPEPPRNTDLHPAAYLYQIALWNRWAGSRLSGLLQSTRRISPLVLPVAVILLMLAGNLTGWRKSHQAQTRFHLSIAIAVLGLSGMSLELLLMFAYQNALGVVYERVAFVVALFMLGLITGGTTSHRLVHRPGMGKRRKMNLLRILLALTALTAALLPLGVMASVRYELAAPVILLSLVAWAGVLTGFGFPLAVSLYQRPGEPVARAAGVLDASDHAGAMCGAVLTATVWLPLWGVTTTALLLAGVNMMLVLWMRGELK